MRNYIYTVTAMSEEDAIDFIIGILISEFCTAAGDEARGKGFRRTLIQSTGDINSKLTQMHKFSPTLYTYKGIDKQGLSIYTFFGTTSYAPLIIKQPQPEVI